LTKLNFQPEELDRIRHLGKVGKDNTFHFLGYTLNLETSEFKDSLEKGALISERNYQGMNAFLVHYSLAKETHRSGKLVKFRDLPGGYAFDHAFIQRAIDPIAQVFDSNPEELIEAAKLFGGKRLDHGNLSVEIPALEGIPLVYILWTTEEFSASANVLFDESASCFLDTEALAVLGQITTERLLKAQSILKKKKQ